jgi:hypothetical protein
MKTSGLMEEGAIYMPMALIIAKPINTDRFFSLSALQ